jgi:hypothetical protein
MGDVGVELTRAETGHEWRVTIEPEQPERRPQGPPGGPNQGINRMVANGSFRAAISIN